MANERDVLEHIGIAKENLKARHEKAIFLGVDERFHRYALFVADQIARKIPKRDFDICIVSSQSLTPHPLWETHDLRIIQIETARLAERVRTTCHISFASYLCILTPFLLRSDYKRLLYMDADLFYRRGDLSQLLDLQIDPYPVAAVRDMSQLRKPNRRHRDFKTMGLGYTKYFNSGFLVIDVKRYCAESIAHRAMDLALRYASKLKTNDQSILNAVLFNNWAELSPVWNFQYSYQTLYFASMFDICLFHFIGRRKPFKKGGSLFPRFITEEYRCFLEMHWPELDHHIPDGLRIEQHRCRHFCALLFHLASFRKYLRNEAYWRSDWDVR